MTTHLVRLVLKYVNPNNKSFCFPQPLDDLSCNSTVQLKIATATTIIFVVRAYLWSSNFLFILFHKLL